MAASAWMESRTQRRKRGAEGRSAATSHLLEEETRWPSFTDG